MATNNPKAMHPNEVYKTQYENAITTTGTAGGYVRPPTTAVYPGTKIGPGLVDPFQGMSQTISAAEHISEWNSFHVRKISNGFLVSDGKANTSDRTRYCKNPKEVADAIIAFMVKEALIGEDK